MVTAQGTCALALMAHCGIKVDRERHDLAYEFLVRGSGPEAYVWYKDKARANKDWADMGRTGSSGLANHLSPYKEKKYKKRALAHAQIIGKHPQSFPDTHGSPIMGTGFTALCANTDNKSFRKLMDNNKWWFILSQCHDGTFYYQPNRDNNPMHYKSSSRVSASGLVALVFAARNKNLYMTGASKK